VFTVHNDFQRSSRLAALSRRVVCVSGASQQLMQRRLPLRRRAVRVVVNGTLGTTRLPPVRDVVAKDLPAATVLFVGGLSSPRKGVEFLIEVFADVVRARPDARLLVVGNRDNPAVEALAARLLPAGSYDFAGFSLDPREYMVAATVLAVPSFEEPFGLVALEARSCGLPVVASRVGGLPEILADDSDGVLLPSGDRHRWRAALVEALDRSGPAPRGHRVPDPRLERFSVTQMEREYARVYAEITRGSR
jgi:glycosyltransferase involved in cell wall biosynthesis